MAHEDEKKFLHDISNPLAAAIFSVDVLADDLRSVDGLPEVVSVSLRRITGALADIQSQIEKRREILKR